MKKFIIILSFIFVAISANAQYITEYQSNNGHVYSLYQNQTLDNIERSQLIINTYEKNLEAYKNANSLFWTSFGVEMSGIAIMGLSFLCGDAPSNVLFIGGCAVTSIASIVATIGLVKLCIAGNDLRHSQLLLSANGIVMTF